MEQSLNGIDNPRFSRYPLSAKDLINPTNGIKIKVFSVLTTFLSFVAYGALVVSVFSEYWLFTYESLVQNINGNETKVTQEVHSGLWKFCYKKEYYNDNQNNEQKINTSALPWKVDEDLCVEVTFTGPLERSSSTLGAIQRIVRSTVIGPCVCLVILMTGLVVNVLGHCSVHKRVYFFVSGVLFVISGLFIILSLVIYAATTNSIAEGWPNVIGKSPAEMQYNYGWSFFLCGISLLASEAAGVFALYYFLAASSHVYKKNMLKSSSLSCAIEQVDTSADRRILPMSGILRNSQSNSASECYTLIRNGNSATGRANPVVSSIASPSSDVSVSSRPQPVTVNYYPFFVPNSDGT